VALEIMSTQLEEFISAALRHVLRIFSAEGREISV